MIPLPRRQQQVLQATVQHYVDTVEPVGSRTLVRRFGLDASPATVRSAMGALEQKGLLTQPHTSAGRVPSPKGYRQFVDALLPEPGGAVLQLQRERNQLRATDRWQSQIEAAASRRTFHQKHEQAITTPHQAKGFELRFLPLRTRDDAQQPSQIGQATCQMVEQIIKSCPLQA